MFHYFYKNWKVMVCPKDDFNRQDGSSWIFKCLDPSSDLLSNDSSYDCPLKAQSAAESFIQKRMVRDNVGTLLDGWVDEGKIAHQEYKEVLDLISQLARL